MVITIIGMLMALLLPAIQSAREAGRRNTCSNNMRNLGTALVNVEATNRGFPGYANIVNDKRASWVVPILSNLERSDIYQIWRTKNANLLFTHDEGIPTTASPWSHALLNILLCPSDPGGTLSTDPLSYVVNCGSAFTANDNHPSLLSTNSWTEDINSGVFFNQAGVDLSPDTIGDPDYNPAAGTNAFKTGKQGPKVTIDFISTNDGTSNTLMLSENLQASNWATDPEDTGIPPHSPWRTEFQIKQNTGFVFFLVRNGANPEFNNTLADLTSQPEFIVDTALINGNAPFIDDLELIWTDNDNPGGLYASRPSSAHPGGVNAYFCDNHYRFLSEEMDYKVYTQLMTPRQTNIKLDTTGTETPKTQTWNYILDETDY